MTEAAGGVAPRVGRYRWVVVALLFAALVFNYIDRQTLGILKPTMSKELGWTNSDFANVVLCFQGAYAISYVVFGRVVDRIGARYGLGIAFVIWSSAQLLTSMTRGLGQLMAARMMLGVGRPAPFPARSRRWPSGSHRRRGLWPTAFSTRAPMWAPSSPR